MVIHVRDLTSGADTASQGAILFAALVDGLRDSPVVSVSFDGIATATASFTNASFLRLAQERGFAVLKDRIKIVGASNQVKGMLRDRVTRSKTLQSAA